MEKTSRITADTRPESLIDFWFRVQHFLRVRAKISRAAGLHVREYELLLAVKAMPPKNSASVSLMAERLCIHQPITTMLVKSLVSKGLLRAERGHRDRRSLALTLTPRGARLLRTIVAQSVNGLQAEGPGLSAALERTLAHYPHRMVRTKELAGDQGFR